MTASTSLATAVLTIAAFGSVFLPACGAATDITVSRLFSDHMVLQRNARVAIWGSADPGDEIDVSFGTEVVTAVADSDGKWKAWINTGAAGGPYELTAKARKSEPKVCFSDILLGDVWLCSGQSNMEWPVSAGAFAEREISTSAEFASVRLLTVSQNAAVMPLAEPARLDGWHVSSPKTVPQFSATAWFFARNYHQATGVPVGVVCSAWGGTTCEAWTGISAIQAHPGLKSIVDQVDLKEPIAAPGFPGSLFNGMIAPLADFRFAGILWYQGESNVGRATQYSQLFPAMIANWREVLLEGDRLPFYFVQLAPYRYADHHPEALPELWGAQLAAFRSVGNCGMVVTTDIGDFADIHPRNKQEVGRRLSLWAIGSKPGSIPVSREGPPADSGAKPASPVASGPLYRSFRIDGPRVVVEFDFVGEGLVAREGESLSEFTVCGADRVFVPARAVIEGETVVVSAVEVPQPVAVRFAWSDTPSPNFFNRDGLPASPFRTDDFEANHEIPTP